MTNPLRGEINLDLNGQSYAIRPTMDVIAKIEHQFGGVLSLGRRIQNNDWSITEIVDLIYLVIQTQDQPFSKDAIFDILIKDGVFRYAVWVLEFLTLALTGANKDDA